MKNKSNIINKLYWVNLVSWIFIGVFRLWQSYYVRLCGTPCDQCLNIATPENKICGINSFYLFFKHNYTLIINLFALWLLITLILSVVLLIIFIKKKDIKKVVSIIIFPIIIFLY